MEFDRPVNGLHLVGSPALSQGVQVGAVTSTTPQADFVTMKTRIPVFIEIDLHDGKARAEKEITGKLRRVIEMGLRAQLITENHITGQVNDQLDFFPKSKSAMLKHPSTRTRRTMS